MSCKTARNDMALAVGDDLEPTAAEMLHQHLAGCPECQKMWRQLQVGFAVLQQSRVALRLSKSDSIWPEVATKIQERQADPRRAEFNGWVAGLAVLAACVLVFVFAQDGSVSSTFQPNSHNLIGVTNAGMSDSTNAQNWEQQNKSMWRGKKAADDLIYNSAAPARQPVPIE